MMKQYTKHILLASVMSLLAATGCQHEDLTANSTFVNGALNFCVGFAGSGEITLTKGTVLTSEDGAVSIPLSYAVTDGIEVNFPDAAADLESASMTKGTQINSEAEFLGEGLTNFTAAGWNADKSEFVPSSTTVSYSDGLWQTANIYRWRDNGNKVFLAYANLPASGATVTNYVNPSVKQAFTCTVPTDAREQNDIMLGWYEGDGGGTSTAAITMVHPLTAVVFKAGEIDESITAIKSISIEGVYVSGSTDVTYTLSGNDIVPTYNWGSSRTGSQTVTLGPADDATELEVDRDGKIGTSFIILPQEVDANSLKLMITVVKEGVDAVFSAYLPTGTWQEGKTNTFTIGFETDLSIAVNDVVENNVKKDLTITNTGNMLAYIRANIVANWVKDIDGDAVVVRPWGNTSSEGTFTDFCPDKWWYNETDGFYYFMDPVAGGSATSQSLFGSYTVHKSPVTGTYLEMTIIAQAVAYDSNKEKVAQAWGDAVANHLNTNR